MVVVVVNVVVMVVVVAAEVLVQHVVVVFMDVHFDRGKWGTWVAKYRFRTWIEAGSATRSTRSTRSSTRISARTIDGITAWDWFAAELHSEEFQS